MFPDLDEARRRFSALEELVIHKSGGWADQEALRTARALLGAARRAIDDAECHAVLSAIEPLLADLYSESGHQKWARSQTSGSDFLRLRILRDLGGVERRITEMEQQRQQIGTPPSRGRRLT